MFAKVQLHMRQDLRRRTIAGVSILSHLYQPFKLRDLTLKNRLVVSPMCQYSAKDGVPNDWHFVHLGSRAVGGAALVIVEATGVSPEARISHGDTGLWNDEQTTAFARITAFIKSQNAASGIQLAHAGRKASSALPWEQGANRSLKTNAWQTYAPSALPFDKDWHVPKEMNEQDLAKTLKDFVDATQCAQVAGFDVVELHAAHGYLLHEFLSPLSNHRTDNYGGSLENRMRFPLEVTKAVRAAWPKEKPLFVRISATDWTDGGWDLEQSLTFTAELKKLGVDLIDVSTGGNVPSAKIPSNPGYQVPFAEAIRKKSQIAVGAVGLITEARQAEEILASQQADLIIMARELLRDPYFPLHAAHELGENVTWPIQYQRAAPHK